MSEPSNAPPPPRPRRPRRLIPLVLFGVALVGMALGVRALTTPARGEDQVDWRHDFQAGVDAASAADKPLLLYFGADWCPPCLELRARVFSQDHVADTIEQRFVPVKIDLTDPNATQQQLAQRYEAQYIPLLVIADAEGTPLTRYNGGLSADNLLQWLDQGAPSASP
ncbi:MAG: thioredoxin family protein [Phycisphaeraceae bacterium]